MREKLHRDPEGLYLHQAILETCAANAPREAIVDTSAGRRLQYGELGELIEVTGRGLIAHGLRAGNVIAIFLANSWEYVVLVHAVTLAGGIPTLLNPSYKEREVRYQLESSGARFLFSDGGLARDMDLSGLPLGCTFYTRHAFAGALPFAGLLKSSTVAMPDLGDPRTALAALPYSSGTTGLPKGAMLSHHNLVANAYQFLAPGEKATTRAGDRLLCFLPLYHIYGLNVVLNPTLMVGGTVVLMPRFDVDQVLRVIGDETVTFIPQVPPVMNALCAAAEIGKFPRQHSVRGTKSGAAPLAPELAKRFEELTGIPVRQGYGMTEASPVTHIGFFEKHLYRPDSIGQAAVQTDCRVIREDGTECAVNEPGELVMRGPQFMRGYWNAPEATESVLRDGWYWSGDVAIKDADGFYKIVDRRKEMIKYKGFPIAPAEVEAVLLEHPAVRDCGVVGRQDTACGEIPVAFVVARDESTTCAKLSSELCGFVGERLSRYKQPQEVRFVESIPRNPSGKILRKDLRSQL